MASFVTRLLTFLTFLLLSVTLTALPTNTDNAALVERQKGCGPNLPCGELVGDGDPHQVIWQKQISTTFDCGGATCIVSDFQQHSFGIRAQLPEDTTWITGGLHVTDYMNTGIYDGECKADPGHRVCIYADIYFTDYSVRSGDRSDCFSTECNFRDGYQIIRAPNIIDQGVSYRCAYDNECAEQGHENWVQGPAGPPRMLSTAAESLSTDTNSAALVERQHGCITISCSELKGDGDPHQWLLHKQVSSWLDCGGTTCGIGEAQLGEEFTIKADTGGADFTAGGFNVVDQVTIPVFAGECTADPGHRVCVKSVIWITHYTVGLGTRSTCFEGCNTRGDTAIIKAPNAIDGGIEYYCAFDDACSEKGDEYGVAGPAGGPPNALTSAALEKRQGCMPGGSCTKLEGNGDPHQWIMHKQLSEKLDCGNSYCLVANVHEIDYPIKANTHGSDWISGDFAVEEEVHTGRSNLACTGGGNQPGQYVCSYAAIWHTDYTVRPGMANSCATDGCQEFDETNIIRSPNTIHDGQIEYYCAWDDACGEQGQENWIAGPAMGPPAPAPAPEQALTSADLAERQTHCMPSGGCAALEGDGDPHQWIKRIQISPFFYCERVHGTLDMCDMFEGRGQISYPLKADIGDAGEWIDGGFDVVESLDTEIFKGNCPGDSIDTVCVFANIYHTDYTVRGGLANECDKDGCIQYENTSIIRSPNAIKEGGTTFECAKNGFCQGQGDFDWIPGPASGPPASAPEKNSATASVAERQNCLDTDCTSLEGDGDPHQWILRKQLSDTLICEGTGSDGCGMVTETDQLAHEVFADTKDAGAWIDGGFTVEQSLWTGKYCGDCPGNPGDRVCVWAEIWHTDYTVRGGHKSSCDGDVCRMNDHTSIIRSPNTIPDPLEDTTYVCALNDDCQARGSEQWVAGPAMGPPEPAHTSATGNSSLQERQSCLPMGGCTSLEGDGDPHQLILHKQLSGRYQCGNDICSISPDQQISYPLSADDGGAGHWTDGGFDVVEELETGTMDGCAGPAGGFVCVFAEIWHTDYTVRGGFMNTCGFGRCMKDDYTSIIRSPNRIKESVQYRCETEHCGDQGYEYWTGPLVGGPP